MKKYIAIVVCAILSITALVLPIGTNARSNAKGNGSNLSVTDVNALNTLLDNADNGGVATYSYTYNEGLNIDRYSLNIINAQMNIEQGSTDNEFDAKEGYVNVYSNKVHPETERPYTTRVKNLHVSDTNTKGKFASDFDFITFADMDMNTGMVKVEYQQDNASWFAGNDPDFGDAYCSGSDLGLDMQEATATIKVYASPVSTDVEFEIAKGQLFVLVGEENGKTHIKYSEGDGFVDGYISSTKYKSAYVMVKHNDAVNDILTKKWSKLSQQDPDRKTYIGASWELYSTKYLSAKNPDDDFVKYVRQGEIIRYYETVNHTYDGTYIRAAKIGYVDSQGALKNAYIDATELMKLEITRLSKPDTINEQSGSANMYVTKDSVYTTLQIQSTIATGTIATRSYVDAELFVKGNVQLIKFNSVLFQDESLDKSDEELNFVAALPIREWITMEDAKIFLNPADAATAPFVNPLNELITSQVGANGCLLWIDFLADATSPELLVANGKSASLKADYNTDLNEAFYYAVNGLGYNNFKPTDDSNPGLVSKLDVSFKKAKNPTIDTAYSFSVPNGDIFLGNTARFEAASERKVVISNVGNTIVPNVVMAEINALLG